MIACTIAASSPAQAEHVATPTSVESRALTQLREFTSWLEANDAEGFIGEVGWPGGDSPDVEEWNHLAEMWMEEADRSGLWVTAWATGEWWPRDYPLAIYTSSTGVSVDTPNTQASVLERHLTPPRRGINVAGAEFAAPSIATRSTFSNESSGEFGSAYRYPSSETFEFLATRGIGLVRLPFRWERLQPRLGKALRKTELDRLTAAIDAAGDAGMDVVLDVHNYGAYYRVDKKGMGVRRPIGSRACKTRHFVDLWLRLSRRFSADKTVVGYGLMNEPTGMRATATATAAERWERISQRVLDTIRARGDRTTILVPGYNWSGAQRWTSTHPKAWISDPAKRFRYEAHHYWDHDNSGTYQLSYEEETARANE